MKWLIVSTQPEHTINVPGVDDHGGAGWNVGDVFARLGTESVIREVDPAAEFDVLNVDDPENLNRERLFDFCVLAGRPLFFPGWQTHHVWTHVLRGWPGRDHRKIMALGVGDCFPIGHDENGDRHLATVEAVRSTWRTILRTEHRSPMNGVCPASWLLLNRPEKMTRKLCNFMALGGHYPDFNPDESRMAQAQRFELVDVLLAHGFEFVAHSAAEHDLAHQLGWNPEDIVYSTRIDRYIEAYASASHYIGNRMHGAVILAGRVARAMAIGFDSRLGMVHAAGCSARLPSSITAGEVAEFAESSPGAVEVARTMAIRSFRAETVKLIGRFAGRRVYVQLGRVGDILNVLPLLKRDADRGIRSSLVVAEEFASVLDGVTYLDPVIYRGKFEDIVGALPLAEQTAERIGAEVVSTQIYGINLHGGELCSSFVRESWSRAPGSPAWGSLPLVFDRRDLSREVGVKAQLLARTTGRPYIVLALSGTSSPFRYNTDLIRYLRNKLGKEYDFVDVSGFTAPRFYDLITLLEGAHALVTIDSALLHLAAAVPKLRVVAFIVREPSPWHGTAWRPQQVARFFYDEAPDCFKYLSHVLSGRATRPKIFHVWSAPPVEVLSRDPETTRRIGFARWTWEMEYENAEWVPIEYRKEHEWRSSDEIGDPRPMPYVRDVINHVVETERVAASDVIAFTNADVSCVPGLTGWIFDAILRAGAAFTHRWDFRRLSKRLTNEAEAMCGRWYPGSDAFFFTVAWWRRHRDEYPDMIYGREHCDEVLRQLIKRHGGREIRGAIYHEKHASFWESEENKGPNPGNQHNRRLARQWFLRKGYGPNDPEWWKLPG